MKWRQKNNQNGAGAERPLKYAWYYSSHHVRPSMPAGAPQPSKHAIHFPVKAIILALIVVGVIIYAAPRVNQTIFQHHAHPAPASSAPNVCAGNASSQLILVSINQRHLWACRGHKSAYDAPVVTGRARLPADATPTGTYHIYGKQTNQHLIGSDSTGSWNDFVYYWMPFLTNQYGEYGFHDATWRPNSAFGNISPDSNDGSHGCVELPLATAKWLYAWAPVGTTVKIEH